MSNKDLIAKAIALADSDFYPLFPKPSSRQFKEDYLLIEVFLSIQPEDKDCSLEVLDVSCLGPEGSVPAASDPANPFLHTDSKRTEMLFFVCKNWTEVQAKMFTALNFARFLRKGLISLVDMEKILNEFERIYAHFILKETPSSNPDSVESVSFVLNLYKDSSEETSGAETKTIECCPVSVEVSVQGCVISKKRKKFEALCASDPVQLPTNVTFLHQCVTFKRLDTAQWETQENAIFSEEQVKYWDFSEMQRLSDLGDPNDELNYLLQERRKNPNRNVDSSIDLEAENQARAAKIWSQYDRDYMFRNCQFAIPYALDQSEAERLYQGQPETSADLDSEDSLTSDHEQFDILDKQLMRTRVKQEGDVIIHPTKEHDDVEARRACAKQGLEPLSRLWTF